MLSSDEKRVVWICGRPASGKTTLGRNIVDLLSIQGYKTSHLDGDILRKSVNVDLGFSLEDRQKAAHNAAKEALRQLEDHHVIVVSMVTPTERSRRAALNILDGKVIFVYTYSTIPVCAARDTKGLYECRAELVTHFETPKVEHIRIDTRANNERETVRILLQHLFDLDF